MINLDKICESSERVADIPQTMICPEGHQVPYKKCNYSKDFSDGDIDVMNGQPMYESGLFCHECKRAYGISKLKESK